MTRALDTFVREWKHYDECVTETTIKQHLDQELRSSDAKEVISELSKLRYLLMTNKKLEGLSCESAADYETWSKELSKNDFFWFVSPWLFVECYLYRKIADSFLCSKYFKNYDPFHASKVSSLIQHLNAIKSIGKVMKNVKLKTANDLVQWIELSLWGNRCDLSLKSSTPSMDQIIESLAPLRSKIIANDTRHIVNRIEGMKSSGKHNLIIDIVLDNSGFELFTDLCLLHVLTHYLGVKKIKQINIHVKSYPWFVSDVMRKDFWFTLDYLSGKLDTKSKDKSHAHYQHYSHPLPKIDCKDLIKLIKEWIEFVDTGKWIIAENYYWTLPYDYSAMKTADVHLYRSLSASALIIFKGDLNYRKLLGDLDWDPKETSFAESLRDFKPTFLTTLRTNKATLISGLKGILIDDLPVDYLTSGEYAVIQVCDENSSEL